MDISLTQAVLIGFGFSVGAALFSLLRVGIMYATVLTVELFLKDKE